MFTSRLRLAGLLLTAVAGAAAVPRAAAQPDLTPEQFERLHRLIKPQPGESRWAEVPWLTNLAEARRRAAAEDRPLLLWRSGGGDVLGRC
jgi:hypothetical protein